MARFRTKNHVGLASINHPQSIHSLQPAPIRRNHLLILKPTQWRYAKRFVVRRTEYRRFPRILVTVFLFVWSRLERTRLQYFLNIYSDCAHSNSTRGHLSANWFAWVWRRFTFCRSRLLEWRAGSANNEINFSLWDKIFWILMVVCITLPIGRKNTLGLTRIWNIETEAKKKIKINLEKDIE